MYIHLTPRAVRSRLAIHSPAPDLPPPRTHPAPESRPPVLPSPRDHHRPHALTASHSAPPHTTPPAQPRPCDAHTNRSPCTAHAITIERNPQPAPARSLNPLLSTLLDLDWVTLAAARLRGDARDCSSRPRASLRTASHRPAPHRPTPNTRTHTQTQTQTQTQTWTQHSHSHSHPDPDPDPNDHVQEPKHPSQTITHPPTHTLISHNGIHLNLDSPRPARLAHTAMRGRSQIDLARPPK